MKYLPALLGFALLLSSGLRAQTTNTLSTVQFIDANTVVASGAAGTILRSNDGGMTWANQVSGTTDYLVGLSFTSTSIGTVVGGNPLISTQSVIHTIDGGATWLPQLTGTTVMLLGVSFADANNGWAVGNNGKVFRTADGGTIWGPQTSGVPENLEEVKFVDANTGFVAGDWGRILKTTNGGASWVAQSSGVNTFLYGVSFVSSTTGTIVGNAGTVLRTTNGGASWVSQSSGTTANLTSVCFIDASNGWAVGWTGIIRRTANSGATWTAQTSGTTADLYGVSFADVNTGVAVGLNGKIIRTTNGGATWGPPSGGGGSTPPAQPTLASPANGATNQPMTVTLSWNASSGASTYRLQVSTNSNFSTTVYDNANLTSTSQSVGPLATSTTHYWHVSASNSAGTSAYSSIWSFTTNNGGPLFSVTPTSINFGTVIVVSSKKDSVTVTNSGGSTLSITSIVSSKSNFTVSPTSASVPPGGSQKVYVTFKPTKKTSYTASITFTHNAPGSPGTVSVSGSGASAPRGKATAKVLASEIPDEIELRQNYPNPFNPSTVIEYAVPEESFVTLTVFNIIGQEVATLVSEAVPSGYHSSPWTATSAGGVALPSGMYLYRLNVTSLKSDEVASRFGKMQLIR